MARGDAWSGKGELGRAIADLNEAIRLAPDVPVFYMSRGGVWMIRREPDKALADFTEAIRLDPKNPFCFRNRAAPGQPRAIRRRPTPTSKKPSRLEQQGEGSRP